MGVASQNSTLPCAIKTGGVLRRSRCLLPPLFSCRCYQCIGQFSWRHLLILLLGINTAVTAALFYRYSDSSNTVDWINYYYNSAERVVENGRREVTPGQDAFNHRQQFWEFTNANAAGQNVPGVLFLSVWGACNCKLHHQLVAQQSRGRAGQR